MSSGALTQIATRGPQDTYLLSPSEHTYFKRTYPRHTNFAQTELEMPFESNTGFGRSRMRAKLSRSGDLVSQVYLYSEIDALDYENDAPPFYDIAAGSYAYYANSLGHAMIDEVSVSIGAHEFDRHTGEFMEIMEALTAPSDRLLGEMTGYYSSILGQVFAAENTQYLYTPLKFWFNRFYEQALPVIALFWNEVQFEVSTVALANLWNVAGGNTAANMTVSTAPSEMHLLCNYIYLDNQERNYFSNGTHEYVFDQVQYFGSDTHTAGTTSGTHSIRFNHPVNEIIWVCQRDAVLTADATDHFNFSGPSQGSPTGQARDPFDTAQIQLNGNNRTLDHRAVYYRLVQPYQHHSRIPHRWVYSYSFGLRPENLLDTGSVNMSRMDTANVRITYGSESGDWTGSTRFYGRSKNIFKISSGLAGIKFSA